ncbi:ATP-binding protein [Sorangium cellulosum]
MTAAGRHNVLLMGTPGSGRAGGPRPMPTIMPRRPSPIVET